MSFYMFICLHYIEMMLEKLPAASRISLFGIQKYEYGSQGPGVGFSGIEEGVGYLNVAFKIVIFSYYTLSLHKKHGRFLLTTWISHSVDSRK